MESNASEFLLVGMTVGERYCACRAGAARRRVRRGGDRRILGFGSCRQFVSYNVYYVNLREIKPDALPSLSLRHTVNERLRSKKMRLERRIL